MFGRNETYSLGIMAKTYSDRSDPDNWRRGKDK